MTKSRKAKENVETQQIETVVNQSDTEELSPGQFAKQSPDVWKKYYAEKLKNFDFASVKNVANLTDSYFEYRVIVWVGHAVSSNYFKDDNVPEVIHTIMQQIDCINSMEWNDDKCDDTMLDQIRIPSEVAWLIQPMLVRWQSSDRNCNDLTLKPDHPVGVTYDSKVLTANVDRLFVWFKRGNVREKDVLLNDVRKALSIENVLDFYMGNGFVMVKEPNPVTKLPVCLKDTVIDLYNDAHYDGDYVTFLNNAFDNHDIGVLFGVQDRKAS